MKNKHLLKSPIYLFPLTAEAVLMYHILKNNGFTINGLCDNNPAIHGENYDNCPIIPPVIGENETVILCGHRLYIHDYLFKASIKIEQFLTVDDIEPALFAIDKDVFAQIAPKQMTKLGRLKHEIRQVVLPVDDGFILNTINISVTERCNLKCRYCAALMQYYEKPCHMPLETLIADIDLLMSKVDFVRDIHILGGEPFIYPHLAEYVRYLRRYREKIGSLYLITNGTVIPNEEVICALAESELLVRISDYGELSRKKDELVEEFSKKGVMVQITQYPWTWENQLTYDDKTDIQHKFNECFAKRFNNCVSNGKLYYCDFLENAEKLRMVPYHSGNALILREVTSDEIVAYISSEKAPVGCVYCSGHDHKVEIAPAEQADSVLQYKLFMDTYVEGVSL